MRKIIVTEYITLDGVFEEPGHWSLAFWSDEAAKYKYEELFSSGALLLGRVTYDGFAKAWPTMKGTGEFGERMNSIPKYVVSTTLKQATWNNSTIIKDHIVETIKKLKKEKGKDILLAGSGKLLQTLSEKDLLDEYRFMLHPLILGKGKRLFTAKKMQLKLQLVETKTLPKGIVILHYLPKGK